MSEDKFTADDLEEKFHQMTREELLDEIAFRIESYEEMCLSNYEERKELRDENKQLWEMLARGKSVMDALINEKEKFEALFKVHSNKTLMWKYSCYGMVLLFIFLMLYIITH